MDDKRDDDQPDEPIIVIEPTTQRDREVTQQLEQAVSRVRRAREVLDRAKIDSGRDSLADGYDTERLARSRSVAGARVLLIDDEDVIRRLMTRMIEGHGCVCTPTPSGEDALPLLEKQVFDLLILDKNLPGMSGIEVAKLCRRYQPGVPILMITGYASEDSALEAAAYGVTDYVMKPIDLEDFRRRMIHALTSRSRPGRSSSPDLGRRDSSPGMTGGARRRDSRQSGSRISLTSRPPPPNASGPLRVNVLLFDPKDETRKKIEQILKPICTQLAVFAEVQLAQSFARASGFDVLVAVPEFLSDAMAWWEDVPGRPPLGAVAIMDRGGIDKAIEAIQLGARGSLHPPFDEAKTQFDFRRAVTALLEERRSK